MKKTLLIVALVLAITTSIIAGTMAYYTITLDELVEGDVVAKEFILEGEMTSEHEAKVKIAPGESETWTFKIKNFENEDVVTETDMDVTIELALSGGYTIDNNKQAPLILKLNGEEYSSAEKYLTHFTAGDAATKTFTVTVEWPWGTANDDIEFAGQDLGTLSVSVTGTQSQTTTP